MLSVSVASLCRSAKLVARLGASLVTLGLIASPVLVRAAEEGASPPVAAPAAPAQAAPATPAAPAGATSAPSAATAAPPATPAAPAAPAPAAAAGMPPKVTIPIVYLGKQYDEPLPLSYAEEIITDKGIQGARVQIKEANQAGNFVGYGFKLIEAIVPKDGDVVGKAKEILKNGDALIVADLEAPDLLAVADLPEAKNSVILNIRANDVSLRQEECRQNVFHIIPDWAMRSDAIAQYLIWKKWPRWAIIRGDTPADKEFVAQIERSAKRYGGKIVDERVYTFPPGARNLDSGHQQVQTQIPMATEGTPANDVLWVADTEEGFGDYLLYRTYSPSLVVGTQGLQALAWDKSYTESGAMHLQNALPRQAHRKTTERDYTGWLGVRALADSAMRSHKTTPQELKQFLLSDQFKLEGFKGQALTFRTWDHQMRQPIILGGGTRVPVSTSPQEGFLHEKNLTDTLGFDEPESKCKFR
jgi:ABC transporter substrate binding protein (PQQ-dependent alcohol dehydrogenase system)